MSNTITMPIWQIVLGLGVCLAIPLLLAAGMAVALSLTKGETGPPKKGE